MQQNHLQDIFWSVVAECLVNIFNYQRNDAVEVVLDLQRRLRDAPDGLDPDAIYHKEPFTVAKTLARQPEARLTDYREVYERLVNQITEFYITRENLSRENIHFPLRAASAEE